jgi:hypothetical protein
MTYINVENILNEGCEIEVNDFLDELEDDTLAEALKYRGAYVYWDDPTMDYDTTPVEWHVERGDLKEALIELERIFPTLKGIVNLHKE